MADRDGLTHRSHRDLLERIFDEGTRACVCVEAASVVYDDRKPTPYAVSGCVVGSPNRIDDHGFDLEGISFRTQVQWVDVIDAWPRARTRPTRARTAGRPMPDELTRESTPESNLSVFLTLFGVLNGPPALTLRGWTGSGWRADLRCDNRSHEVFVTGAGETPDDAIADALARAAAEI